MNLSVPQKAPLTALVNRVVSKLRRDILNGTYKEGDRLPPFRKLADEFGVSIFTIHRALKELAVENLVFTREGATTLVGKVDPSLLSEVATSDAVSESAKLPEAVRWIRQDSSLRKLRLSILQKTFESSGEGAVKRPKLFKTRFSALFCPPLSLHVRYSIARSCRLWMASTASPILRPFWTMPTVRSCCFFFRN